MIIAENNAQIIMYDNVLPIDIRESWEVLDTWRSQKRGLSVATPIGRLVAPPATGPSDELYVTRKSKIDPDTATIKKLFKLGVQHYFGRSGITNGNSVTVTDLKTGTYGPGDKQPWHIDCPSANVPTFRVIVTRDGAVGPTNHAIGMVEDRQLDGSNFRHPELVGTDELQKFTPQTGELVLFLGFLTLHEGPEGQGWREVHDATVWLNSRPPALAC